MKRKFFYYNSDPPFSKSIEVYPNECKTVGDIKKKISFDLRVFDSNVQITNASNEDKLEGYLFNRFYIKIVNCCKDIDFILPNSSIITIKNCYKMTFPEVINFFFKEKHIYYSEDCIKNIQFLVNYKEVAHIQYPFLGVQNGLQIYVRMKCDVTAIDYGYNRFIFSTNETVSDAVKVIKSLYEGCSCVSISTIDIYRPIKLKSYDKFRSYSKYKLTVDFEIKFKYIKSIAESKQLLDYLSTVYDAKKRIAIIYSNDGELKPENIILYDSYKLEINDTRKTLKSIQNLVKDQFYFDIDKKKKFHQIPTKKTDAYMLDPVLDKIKYNYEHHSKASGISDYCTHINPGINYNYNYSPREPHKNQYNYDLNKPKDEFLNYNHDLNKPKNEPYENQHSNNVSKPVNYPYKNQNDDFRRPKNKSDVTNNFNLKDNQKYKNKTPPMHVSDDESTESDDNPKIIIPLDTKLSSSTSSQKSIDKSKKTDFSKNYSSSKDNDNKIKTSAYSNNANISDDNSFYNSNSFTNSQSKDDKKFKQTINSENDNKQNSILEQTKANENILDFKEEEEVDSENSILKQTKANENILDFEEEEEEYEDNDNESSILKQTKANGNILDFEEEDNENESFSANISSLLIEEEDDDEYEKKKSTRSKANRYYFQTNKNSKVDEIYLDSDATVKTMKQVIANKEGVKNLHNIKILFAGKELLDDLVLEKLNIGDTYLFIYIRSEEDILLMTAKALQIDTNQSLT